MAVYKNEICSTQRPFFQEPGVVRDEARLLMESDWIRELMMYRSHLIYGTYHPSPGRTNDTRDETFFALCWALLIYFLYSLAAQH